MQVVEDEIYSFLKENSPEQLITAEQAKKRFYQKCDKLYMYPGAKIYMSTEPIIAWSITNCMSEKLDFGLPGIKGFLFFIDPTPDANWGHNCLYVVYDPNITLGLATAAKSEWPPNENIVLEEIRQE